MAENTPITVYTAECIGNAANCLYPNEVKITDDFSAKLAFATDMVCARYKNNYRNTANFEVANALPGDCDNDHSDEPADWVTPEDIADLFADVSYVLHFSRHHMKPKGEKGARPRFHIVFLTDPEQDADRYTALKQRLLTSFPFFDANAIHRNTCDCCKNYTKRIFWRFLVAPPPPEYSCKHSFRHISPPVSVKSRATLQDILHFSA